MKSSNRDNRIDAAKMIAMAVVLLNHSGLKILSLNYWGGMFYVPLFFVTAGYTYSLKDCTQFEFMKNKAKRLLVPYVITNVFLVAVFIILDLVKNSFSSEKAALSALGIFYSRNQLFKNDPVVNIMTSLNSPTWFLPALFVTLIAADILFRAVKSDIKKMIPIITILFMIMIVYQGKANLLLMWGIDILPYLLVLFLFGHVLKKAGLTRNKKIIISVITLALLLVSAYVNGSYNLSISYFGGYGFASVIPSLICALSSVYLVFAILDLTEFCLPSVNAFIAKGAKHTLTILCLHYPVMQIYISSMKTLIPEASDKSAADSMIRLSSIVVSFIACLIFDMVIGKIKSREDKDEKR